MTFTAGNNKFIEVNCLILNPIAAVKSEEML
jgi:hypothetical protein